MFLQDFNKSNQGKIKLALKRLSETNDVNLDPSKFQENTLNKLITVCENNLTAMRNTNKPYHKNPDYTKYLNMREVAELALNEGIYAQSPNMMLLKDMLANSAQELLDRGYNSDEAEKECMNRYRSDANFIYDDEFVLPMVQEAIMEYINKCDEQRMMEELDDDEARPYWHERDLDDGSDVQWCQTCMGEGCSDCDDLGAIYKGDPRDYELEDDDYDQFEGYDMTLENKIQKALAEGNTKVARRLMAKLREAKQVDQDGDGKNDFDDVKIARMKASGMEHDDAVEKAKSKKSTKESLEDVLESVIEEMLSEDVDLDQAEVVMATQGMGSDVQDMNEKVGRMMNEDIVAIADQVRKEQGNDAATQFLDQMNAALSAYMEAGKAAKAAIDGVVGTLSGDAPAMDPGMGADMGADLGGDDIVGDVLGGEDPEAMDTNEPAAAGPVDEPLGRAEL